MESETTKTIAEVTSEKSTQELPIMIAADNMPEETTEATSAPQNSPQSGATTPTSDTSKPQPFISRINDKARPVIASILHVISIERRMVDGGIHYVGTTGYRVNDNDCYQFLIVPEASLRSDGWTFTPFVATPNEEILLHLIPLGEPMMDAKISVRLLVIPLATVLTSI